MEVQPTEILKLIFHQLSAVMDLRKCFNTCERWREIVENLFKDRGISNHFMKNKNTSQSYRLGYPKPGFAKFWYKIPVNNHRNSKDNPIICGCGISNCLPVF